ncbi:MAG: response regulator transcription factor [Alistipes sp.]|nr:response regulator transcription factor [Alistipes sp.]MBQ5353161.1 response regulator transcription factor [Alistipes sp.]MBQ6583934.1 response regulator transcription factor [Alistipes sp.]MBR2116690.1 response regulator transcription factor [Alistipes sp.]
MIKVLVFSPSFRMRAMIVGMVTCAGVEVESVTSRRALFKRCSEKLFDRVIIDDLRLFMDGEGSVRRIRAHFTERPKIFVLSSAIDQQSVVSLLECGVDEYLLLPVSPARLRRKVCQR